MAGLLNRGDADMTRGGILRHLISFAVPMLIGLLFQQLYNTVDTIVVGRFVGKEALAAVGSTGSIINMLVGLCAGLSTGASVVISQYYGAHDYERLHDAVDTTILVTFILCAVATFAGMSIVTPMLKLMATPQDVFNEARQYLTIYFAGITGLLVYNMGSAILRAVGDSKRPLFFLCFSAALNIVLDLLFVIRFRLGIAGVAYATILSQFCSSLLVLYTLTATDAPYAIRWSHLKLNLATFKHILSIGLPSAVQQALTSFSNVFVQSYINFFGSACMAGWSSYNKLDVYILIPVQSISMASTTFVGQNYGAGQYARAKEGVNKALTLSLIVTAVCSVIVAIYARPLLWLFSTDEEVLDFGVQFVRLVSPFYITICFNQILGGALRGVGEAKKPMFIMLFSFVVFRQCYLFINKLLGNAFIPVAICYPMGWIVCSTLLIIFYRKSKLYTAMQPQVVEQ